MTSPSAEDHRRAAQDLTVRCAVLTVSDTRTAAEDAAGPLIERLLAADGHQTAARALVPDDGGAISTQLERWLGDDAIQAVIVTGGTGLGRRDVTIDAVRALLSDELEGFGELFRMLSYQQVKSAAMLSRAVGGLVGRPPGAGGDTFVFALPGSPAAVELAVRELIAPQLAHLVWLRKMGSELE